MPRVVVSQDGLRALSGATCIHPADFVCVDEGDVYSLAAPNEVRRVIPGTISVTERGDDSDVAGAGRADDQVRIVVYCHHAEGPVQLEHLHGDETVEALVRRDGVWETAAVTVIPGFEGIFSRSRGILETDKLAKMRVLLVGAGSGGCEIALGIVQSGVQWINLVDPDRIELANIVRHDAGISDIGRLKTFYLGQRLREKNPYVRVDTWEDAVSWDNKEAARSLVAQSDLVICATDTRESRMVINKLCIEERKPCILGAAFRRAYGGQVLVVRPLEGPCYQCFAQVLPGETEDQEIASEAAAGRIAYSDRPVAVEPGLFNDIKPIAQMMVKLAIQILLKGRETTLASLNEDLVAPWFLWINRREAGSPYADLRPLGFSVDGLRILRWYGIELARNPACPVCGDFVGRMTEELGVEIDPAAVQAFGGSK